MPDASPYDLMQWSLPYHSLTQSVTLSDCVYVFSITGDLDAV